MPKIEFNNAAKRETFVGNIYQTGTTAVKQNILNTIKPEYKRLHEEGYIHIHDLEAYGQTYNCLTPDIVKNFNFKEITNYSASSKIHEIFNYYKFVIMNLAGEQPGGIGFLNFDSEIDSLFNKLNIKFDKTAQKTLSEAINLFFVWINSSRTRYCQEHYYLSFNTGLCISEVGRAVTRELINAFYNSNFEWMRPNIIFKVKKKINYVPDSPNYDLLLEALKCTAKKMIPTYLLCDSTPNKKYKAEKISIMGCRTRVVQNLFGDETSSGRGNIAYVSMNLPRLALEAAAYGPKNLLERFKKALKKQMSVCRNLLIDRYRKFLHTNGKCLPFNMSNNFWIEKFDDPKNIEKVFKNATLSIGFIGISEAVEILTGEKHYLSEKALGTAMDIVKFMRETTDSFRKENNLNITLLATSGEYICGKFCELDHKKFKHPLQKKGFYTNSFHVNVDAGIHPFEKMKIEGPFHLLCNGGCISYVEFNSAPLNNIEALMDIMAQAIKNGVSYLGYNYPLDICNDCAYPGTFDKCPKCGSKNIKRIRRVSGYLEELDHFTRGKKMEHAAKKPNLKFQH